ncbi:MAG: hypothetical protein LBU69_00085 [Deltaproteobacteria bacterium]|nr:hypothetical protein [Deltaproteobacteria bacterium]
MKLLKAPLRQPVKALMALFLAAALSTLVVACSVGPMEPARRQLEAKHQDWIRLLQATSVSDEIYELSNLGNVLPIMIKAIPLSDQVLTEARNLWGKDPRFMGQLNSWLSKGKIVVLVGLYTRNIHEDDVLVNNRLRVSLQTADNRIINPANKEQLKTDVLDDYFPIFSPWELVFAFSYDGQWSQNPKLIFDSPYGSQKISLAQGAKF